MRVLAVLGVLVAVPAYADPPGQTPPIAPGPSALDQITHGDAASDRGIAFSSGVVLGRGDVDVSLVSVLEHGSDLRVGVGIGAGVELSLDGIDALGGRYETLGGTARLRLARGPRYSLAAQLGYHGASTQLDSEAPFVGSYLTLGAVVTVAVSSGSLLSFGAGIERYDTPDFEEDSSVAPYAHLDLAMGRWWVRPLFEVGYIGVPFAFVGVRVAATRYVAVDAGIGTASSEIVDASGPLAVVALSIRP